MFGCATLVLSTPILSPAPAPTSEGIFLSEQMGEKHKLSDPTSIEPGHPLPPLPGQV